MAQSQTSICAKYEHNLLTLCTMCDTILKMINSIHSDLIRGHIDTIILSVLHDGDRYGYEILGEIERKSGGEYVLKQPTLYSCLKRLETQGFIYKYWGTETNGGRRTYYSLTEMGKTLFERNKDEWSYSCDIINKLIGIDGEVTYHRIDDNDPIANAPVTEYPDEEQDVEEEDVEETETEDVAAASIESIDDAYAEVIANEEAKALTEDYETHYSDTINGYCYADRQDDDNLPVKDDVSFGTSLFAKDYSEDLEEEKTDTEYSDINGASDENYEVSPSYDAVLAEDVSSKETFRKYNETVLPEETDREITIIREYRDVINALLRGHSDENDLDAFVKDSAIYNSMTSYSTSSADSEIVTDSSESEITADDSAIYAYESSISKEPEKRGQVNFEGLASAVNSMGDDFRIRVHNSEAQKEYNGIYQYYSNKLDLFKYGILFAIMLIEIIVPYFIIKFGAKLPIAGELPVLIISVILAAMLPIYSAIAYLVEPYKRKRYNFNLKSSLLYRIGIMALLFVLIYAANVVFMMDIAFETDYLFSLITPALLATNVPLASLIFKKLYDTKKFAVTD